MITTDTNLAKQITAAFIAENPRQVILRRRPRITTTAGGFTLGNPVNQEAQTFRKIDARTSGMGGAEIVTADGNVIVPAFMLVCPLDANIQRNDLLTVDNKEYQIGKLHKRDLLGRIVAEVMEYG